MRSPHLHRLRRASVALATALTLLASTVHADAPGPPDEASRLEQARERYAADDYLPAADAFEALHRDTQNPLYLYYAGLAREGAGHDAHAIRHWQQALRLGLEEEFTAKAQVRLEQARARTTALTVTVDPPGLTDRATLELRAAVGERQPISLPLGELPVHLEPGKWTAIVSPNDPGFSPLEIPLTIARGAAKMTQQFKLTAIEYPTTFEFTPLDAPLVGVVLTLRDAGNLTPERSLPVQTRQLKVSLRPGAWTYTLAVPGHPPLSGSLDVTPDAPPVLLSLPAAPVQARSDAFLAKPVRRKLGLGLGLGALAPAIGGGVLTGLAVSAEGKFKGDRLPEADLRPVSNRYLGGMLMLGATAGLWTGAILSSTPLKRRAWYATLGVGIAFGLGGLGANVGTLASRKEHFRDPGVCPTCGSLTANEWKTDKAALVVSSLLAGLGAGLALAAASNLLAGRRRPGIAIRPSSSGLGFHF